MVLGINLKITNFFFLRKTENYALRNDYIILFWSIITFLLNSAQFHFSL